MSLKSSRKFTVSIVRLVFIHILKDKMTFFGICFFLYFVKLSAGRGFYQTHRFGNELNDVFDHQ